jgi:hypothetical protein
MTDDSIDSAQDRIREYFAAALRGDADACAEQWVYPACILAAGHWSAMADAAACREALEEQFGRARAGGVTGGRILELSARAEGRHAAWVEGRFSQEGVAGRVIAETRRSYLVVNSMTDWRIAVCVEKG